MKKLIPFSILLFITISGFSQSNPVGWRMTVQPGINDSVKEIHLDANIDEGWQLYSNDFRPDLGPIRAEFMFVVRKDFTLIGGTLPQGSKRKYDELWGGEYAYFEKKAKFIQQISTKMDNPPIQCNFSYQVCNTVDGKCIPFETSLKINTEY